MGIALRIGSLALGSSSLSRSWTPQIPTGVTLTVVSDTVIKVDWTNIDTSGTGVSIERSTNGSTYSEVATVTLGTTHYHNTGLTSNTLYYYRVKLYKGAVKSDPSNVASETTYATETYTYYNAAGLTDGTTYFGSTAYEITGKNAFLAFDKFIKGIKSDLLWDKVIALYPFFGVNYTSAKLNIINPADSDAAHRLEEGGSPAYSGTGVAFNGSNNYLRTNIIPSAQGAYNNFSTGFYMPTQAGQGTKYLYGVKEANDKQMALIPNYNGTSLIGDIIGFSNRISNVIPNNGIGFWQFWVESDNLYFSVDDSNYIGKTAITAVTLPDLEIYLGCLNNGGSAASHDASTLSIFYYGINMNHMDTHNLALRVNQLNIDLKRITYTAISKSLNFVNTGNKAISDYMAEVELTGTEFNFTNIIGGNHLNILDGAVNQPYYISAYDRIGSKVRLFTEVDIPANGTKTLTLNTGVNSTYNRRNSQLMQRKSAISITKSLYNMSSVSDSMGVGNDMTLVNSSLVNTPEFGWVLDCNSKNGYATIVRDFDWNGTYDTVTISFKFCFKKDFYTGMGSCMIFSKYINATNQMYVNCNSGNGTLIFLGQSSEPLTGSYTTTTNYWRKFEPHSVTIRMNKYRSIWYFDNKEICVGACPIGTGGQPFTFGCYNTGTAASLADAYIWDIEFTQGRYELGLQFARDKGITQKQVSQATKWDFITEVPDTAPDDKIRQEPNILTVGTELHLYCTDETTIPSISRRVSTNNGVTWSDAVAISLTDVASAVSRTNAFQDGGKIYIVYMLNADVHLYIQESTDGLNFTNKQLFMDIPAGYTGLQNSCIQWDATLGKYYAIIDGTKAGWTVFLASGTTLYNITYEKDLTFAQVPTSVAIAGGAFFKLINGVYHLWVHSNNPSRIYHYTNSDITADTWVRVYPNNPVFTLQSKWAQQQVADISICEKSGVCYAAVNNSGDAYNTTGNTDIYKYDGTFEQLVSDLSITLT